MACRAVVLVVDSLGIGALPDAHLYGDEGSHTLDNTARAVGGLKVENLARLGLGRIEGVKTVEPVETPLASFGRMMPLSPAKDTTAGHWELMGVPIKKPFATFPDGFPPEIMERFKKETGYDYLWAKPASGTEIIERLGREHLKTGKLIVYTSADSVFQIAAHEELIPPEELYRVCRIARAFLNEYNVGRVIARPFITKDGRFVRTERRKDFSIPPPEETLLDVLKNKGVDVVGVGKVDDIFAHRGFSHTIRAHDNRDVLASLMRALDEFSEGFFLATLGDFDTIYGHRNDPHGYARALEEVDTRLPHVMEKLNEEDIFIITADHGCDPTTPSTDHSREYVPLIVYGKRLKKGVSLGTRSTLADVAKTVAEYFGTGGVKRGVSFLGELLDRGRLTG